MWKEDDVQVAHDEAQRKEVAGFKARVSSPITDLDAVCLSKYCSMILQ